MSAPIYAYLFIMWIMIVAGGGLLATLIAPIHIHGFGKFDEFFDSGAKAVMAITLVILWIFIMSKAKNWIFHKRIRN